MFIASGVFNIIAALLFAWWSFGEINNFLLLIPSALFLIVGCLSIEKVLKQKDK